MIPTVLPTPTVLISGLWLFVSVSEAVSAVAVEEAHDVDPDGPSGPLSFFSVSKTQKALSALLLRCFLLDSAQYDSNTTFNRIKRVAHTETDTTTTNGSSSSVWKAWLISPENENWER